MLSCYRIARARYAREMFSGAGALQASSRWLPKGYRAIYAAGSRALAVLEYSVNDPAFRHAELAIAEMQIPDEIEIYRPNLRNLSKEWPTPDARERRWALGVKWYQAARFSVMCVPSAIIMEEFNYVFNVAHPQFKQIIKHKPKPLYIDPRL